MIFLLVVFFYLTGSSNVWALNSTVRFMQGARVGLRSSEGTIPSELVERVEWEWATEKGDWRVTPFFEGRWSMDTSDDWSRLELGAELGFQPVSWLYFGQGLHQAWLSPGRDHLEWETRTRFTVPLPWQVRSQSLHLYLLNEYTFDVEMGEAVRNELSAGIQIPLPWERWEMRLGWRHVDLIHHEDMDQIEGAVLVQF